MSLAVSIAEAAQAFTSGTSSSNAIAVLDAGDVNGNPSVELEDIDLDKMLDVNSAIAVEKEIAADTIGTLFAATQGHFLPYVEPCTLELISLLMHYYEGIRKSATDSLLEIIRTFYDLSDTQEWQPGTNAVSNSPCLSYLRMIIIYSLSQVVPALTQNVQDLINHILPPLLMMYESEDNK